MTSLSWLYTFMLLVFILLFCMEKTDASVARGTEFFIAFPQHPRDGTSVNNRGAELLIWNPNQQTVSLNISLRISPTFSEIRVPPTGTYKHILPDDIQLFGSTKFSKSVHVIASAPVEVQVLSTWDETNPKSMGSFLALPRDSLSQEYLIATLCFEYNCTLVVIMTQNNTDLYIDLRVTAGKSVTYNNAHYTDGDVINATGDIGDVIQVLCSICDLSGTRIRATENVAVIAGGQFTPIVSGSTTNDMVVEQFLPWSHFGSRYVLTADVIYPVSNETVKVVTNCMNTTFHFRNTCYTSSRSRQVFQFTRPSTEFVEITATQKILVARFTEPKKVGDSVMVIPSPVTTWQTSYDLGVLSQTSNETHLVLIMERVSAASIVFEGNMTSAIEVKTVNISDQYASMTLALDAGNYSLRFKCNVTLPTCRPFSGYLYSYYNLYKGWSIALLPETIGNISDEVQVVTECMSKAPSTQTISSSNIITTFFDQTTFLDVVSSQLPAISVSSQMAPTDGLSNQTALTNDLSSPLESTDYLSNQRTVTNEISSQITFEDGIPSQKITTDGLTTQITSSDIFSSQTLFDILLSHTFAEDVSSQTLVDVSSQTLGDDVSGQTLLDDVSSQTLLDDVSSQTLGDDVSSQTLLDDVSSQILTDEVSSQKLTDDMSIHTLADEMLIDLLSTIVHIDHVTSFSDYYADTFSETILSDATAKLPELLESSQDSTDLNISSEFQYLQSNSEERGTETTKTIQQVTASRLQQDATDIIQQEITHRIQHETEVAQQHTASIIPLEPSYGVNFAVSHTTAGYVTQQAFTTPLDRQQETTEQPSQATTKEIAITELTTSLHIMPTHETTTEIMQEKTTFTSEIQLSYTQLQDLTSDMSPTQTSVGDLQASSFIHSGEVVLSTSSFTHSEEVLSTSSFTHSEKDVLSTSSFTHSGEVVLSMSSFTHSGEVVLSMSSFTHSGEVVLSTSSFTHSGEVVLSTSSFTHSEEVVLSTSSLTHSEEVVLSTWGDTETDLQASSFTHSGEIILSTWGDTETDLQASSFTHSGEIILSTWGDTETLIQNVSSQIIVVSTTSPKPSEQTRTYCPCSCTQTKRNDTVTRQEIQHIVAKLQEELTVKSDNISKTKRKKICVPDSRPLSIAAGSLAIIVIGTVIGFLVLFDIRYFVNTWKIFIKAQMRKKKKRHI